MTFEHTAWFIALLILPLILVGSIWTYRSRRKAWDKLVSPRLRSKLVITTSHWRTWVSLALSLLGLLLLIISLARPQAGHEEQEERIRGRNILIAVDTSRSMRVTDVKPSRLDAARALCFELLDALPNDRIGIIAFANSTHILAPLTIDHSALRETVEQMDHDNIPEGGSNISNVVAESLKVFKETGQRSNALIIISDGEDHGPSITAAAEDASTDDIPVIAIAVGTDDGGLIPDNRQTDGKFRDRNNKPVLSRMNPKSLRHLAKATNGRFAILSSQQNVSPLILNTLNSLESSEMESRIKRIPNERYQWFLAPAFFLLLSSALIHMRFSKANWRNTSTALITFSFFLISFGHSKANSLNEAQSSYSKEDYESSELSFSEAINNYKSVDPKESNPITSSIKGLVTGQKTKDLPNLYFGRGSTRYKQGNFKDARTDFSKALLSQNKDLQKEAHYNLGNTLFKQGDATLSKLQQEQTESGDLDGVIKRWKESTEHFESSLSLDSSNENAKQNLAYVKKRLEELKQQQQEKKKQEQQKEDQEKKDGEGKDQEKKDQKQDDKKSDQDQQKSGENNKPGDQDQENKKEGEGEKGEEKKDGKSGDQEKKDQENKPGEQNEEQEKPGEDRKDQSQEQEGSNGNQSQQKNQQGPSQLLKEGPREEETPEQYAQRILKEGADMKKNVQRKENYRERTPDKNW